MTVVAFMQKKLKKKLINQLKTIVIITKVHDGTKSAWTSLEKYLKAIDAPRQVKTAIKRRKMPFDYYGVKFERLTLNQN